jgi:hypothetical protein
MTSIVTGTVTVCAGVVQPATVVPRTWAPAYLRPTAASVALDEADAATVTHVVKEPPGVRSTAPWAVAAHPFAVAVVRLAVMPLGRDPVRVGVTRCRRVFAVVLEVSLTVTLVVADEPRSTERVVGVAVAESPMVAEVTPAAWRFARLTHEACVPPVTAPPMRRTPTTAARSRVRADMSRRGVRVSSG